MNDLLIILSLASFSWMVAGMSDLDSIRPQFRPFNCPMCFAFWLSLIILPFIYGVDIRLIYAPLIAIVANEIDKFNP